jgi:hypothetical protein
MKMATRFFRSSFFILCFMQLSHSVAAESIPVAVCEDQLNVSLTSDGTAIVLAQSFDEGSYDYFCGITLAVKKTYDPYDDFGPWVEFDCYDIGQLVSVELKVTNCWGESNSCWVDVMVEDKLPPSIHCPYNTTVECSDVNDWSYMDQATAYDACGISDISFWDMENTTSCGTGYITRQWKATDNYGNMSTCIQTIHVVDNTPVVVHFPPDYTSYDCVSADDLLPENLPEPFNEPTVLYEDCELIAKSFDDWVFTAAPNSCIKIIRQWRVIDWCSYSYGSNQGIWEDTQILKIQDTIPPTATCPENLTVSTSYNACTANFSLPMPTDIQDCLPDVEVSIHGDLGSATSYTNIPIGEYEVGYLLKDGCNNASSCHITVSVVDGINPGPVCFSGVSLSLMANGEAELWASDIEQGSSIDNCTNYQHLSFRLGFEPPAGQTTPPDEDFLAFDCSHVGQNTVALWAGDAAGNWSYCLSTVTVSDNQGICDTMMIDSSSYIAGRIEDEQGDKIPLVDVFTDSSTYWTNTDSAGLYSFGAMPMNEEYIIAPGKTGSPLDGITVIDLITLAKHLMGVDSLDSPYQYIAADADRNGVLNNDDMVIIHYILLGIETSFPDNVSWRFVPKSFDFPADDPLSVDFPEVITINNLEEDVDDADFIGIKIGDLDASLMQTDTAGLLDTENRNAGKITVEDQRILAGQSIKVPVYLDAPYTEGLQLKFTHPDLTITKVETDDRGVLYPYLKQEESLIHFVPATGITEGDQKAIFHLTITADKDAVLSDRLQLNSANSMAYGRGQHTMHLSFKSPDEKLSLHTVYPNPVQDQANFLMSLRESGDISLSIWKADGQLVYQQERYLDAGQQLWKVSTRQLAGKGIYIYRLTNSTESFSGRLIMAGE